MAKFVKKPSVIEAVRWEEILWFKEMPDWLSEALRIGPAPGGIVRTFDNIHVFTLEGETIAYPGYWIVRGVKGELYPCRDDIFRELHDPVPS